MPGLACIVIVAPRFKLKTKAKRTACDPVRAPPVGGRDCPMPPGAPPGSGTAFARGATSVGAMRIRVIRHPAAAAIRFHRTAAATSRPTRSSRRASKLVMILQCVHAQLQPQLRAAVPLQILLQPLDVAPFDRPAVVHGSRGWRLGGRARGRRDRLPDIPIGAGRRSPQ